MINGPFSFCFAAFKEILGNSKYFLGGEIFETHFGHQMFLINAKRFDGNCLRSNFMHIFWSPAHMRPPPHTRAGAMWIALGEHLGTSDKPIEKICRNGKIFWAQKIKYFWEKKSQKYFLFWLIWDPPLCPNHEFCIGKVARSTDSIRNNTIATWRGGRNWASIPS